MSSLSFADFIQVRKDASLAYVRGDATPLLDISTQVSPASFFGPKGGVVNGARQVLSHYDKDAAAFESASETHFEILHHAESKGLGYLVAIQHATVSMAGAPKPISMKLRLTEIFRQDDGVWKIIHRHADPLAEPEKS